MLNFAQWWIRSTVQIGLFIYQILSRLASVSWTLLYEIPLATTFLSACRRQLCPTLSSSFEVLDRSLALIVPYPWRSFVNVRGLITLWLRARLFRRRVVWLLTRAIYFRIGTLTWCLVARTSTSFGSIPQSALGGRVHLKCPYWRTQRPLIDTLGRTRGRSPYGRGLWDPDPKSSTGSPQCLIWGSQVRHTTDSSSFSRSGRNSAARTLNRYAPTVFHFQSSAFKVSPTSSALNRQGIRLGRHLLRS